MDESKELEDKLEIYC